MSLRIKSQNNFFFCSTELQQRRLGEAQDEFNQDQEILKVEFDTER